jgi:hypothetical protein
MKEALELTRKNWIVNLQFDFNFSQIKLFAKQIFLINIFDKKVLQICRNQ